MKFEFSRQIFEKVLNIKFHQNPSVGSRVVAFGQTDMEKLTVAFRNFANTPKNEGNSKDVQSSPLLEQRWLLRQFCCSQERRDVQ